MPDQPTSTLTRRGFVKSSVAAAIAAPTIVPASVFGSDKPGDRVNLGFIGIGKQSSGHLNWFLGKPGNQVVAVCDVEESRLNLAKEAAEKKYASLGRADYKGCDAYKDHRELLAREDIDAVVIGTPDHWHTSIIIEACKAKKDIYCEKPLTLTIEEAHQAIKAVRKYERVFQTGSQQRSENGERPGNKYGKHLEGVSRFRIAAEYVRSGRLGKITEVHVHIGKTSKPCDLPAMDLEPGLDWERWLGQAPMRPWHEIICRRGKPGDYPFNPGWRDYREYSGGHVTDWGAHHYDITQWALDQDEAGPTIIIPPDDKNAEEGVKHIYDTQWGPVLVTHKTSGNGIRFIGTEGQIWVNRGELKCTPESILKQPLTDGDVHLYDSPGHRDDWLACIKTRKRPICDVEVGARSVTVCHLANLAYWNDRVLRWDPKKWEFPGDAEANGWRTRQRREGYELPAV